jgi:hypothetical protein
MVRQALASAEPPPRKMHRCERPAIGPLQPFIDGILARRNALRPRIRNLTVFRPPSDHEGRPEKLGMKK